MFVCLLQQETFVDGLLCVSGSRAVSALVSRSQTGEWHHAAGGLEVVGWKGRAFGGGTLATGDPGCCGSAESQLGGAEHRASSRQASGCVREFSSRKPWYF